MNKKICITFLMMFVITFIGGCDSNKEVQKYAWPLATCSTDKTITHVFATSFAEEVGKLSDGRMQIQVYPQSTLGGDRELLESCRDGDIPFIVQSPAPQVSFMNELSILDAPCLFRSIDEARETVSNKEFKTEIQKVYNKSGYILLEIADQGFRVMTTNDPYDDYRSFEGQKIRTMENKFHIMFWKAIGANPTPMSFTEVYIGLQQGTIDAEENSYETIVCSKLYEQQKNVVKTNAVPDYTTLVMSKSFFDELDKKDQEIINQAAVIAAKKAHKEADKRIYMREETLKKEGINICDVDEDTWKKMKEACKPVYEAIKKESGDKLYNIYIGDINE